jgi:hypothetical protein
MRNKLTPNIVRCEKSQRNIWKAKPFSFARLFRLYRVYAVRCSKQPCVFCKSGYNRNDPLFVHLWWGRIRLLARGNAVMAMEPPTGQVALLKKAINVQ